jgi:hypothetical protein
MEEVVVGNGTGLKIENIGSSLFQSPNFAFFKLKDVLHCPQAFTNLLSIQKFCTDNHCYFILTASNYFVKDLLTYATLLEGRNENGIYRSVVAWDDSSHRDKDFYCFDWNRDHFTCVAF